MARGLRYSVFLLAALSLTLNAAPPQTLDYQGYLADSGGVPLTGSVNVSVSFYTESVGGTSLWTQASSPTLTNGRFTVVLDGSGGNAFPTSLFDQQLYVGLTVDTDPEMTPRQSLTSVPSAFEAINADTVDGLQANEIITAASDEVRTPISSLPFTINTSGSYYVTQNLDGIGGGINVSASNVTIDLMGFTLDGNGANDDGINLTGRSAVEIKNGTIREFGLAGIYNSNASGDANVVTNVRVIENGSLGTGSSHAGIHLVGSSNRVERCIAKDNGGYGIFVGANSIVDKNIAENSGGAFGIYGGQGSTLSNNTAYNNEGSYGIYGTIGATLVNNTAHSNDGWGIYASGGNTVIGNTVTNNNLAVIANQGGLRISNDTLAKDNLADSNFDTGIYVGSTDNVLRNNHATDSITVGVNNRCFYFASNDNAVIGNTATGCTTEFSGAYPTVVDRDNDAF